jgi:hypothetical protein
MSDIGRRAISGAHLCGTGLYRLQERSEMEDVEANAVSVTIRQPGSSLPGLINLRLFLTGGLQTSGIFWIKLWNVSM